MFPLHERALSPGGGKGSGQDIRAREFRVDRNLLNSLHERLIVAIDKGARADVGGLIRDKGDLVLVWTLLNRSERKKRKVRRVANWHIGDRTNEHPVCHDEMEMRSSSTTGHLNRIRQLAEEGGQNSTGSMRRIDHEGCTHAAKPGSEGGRPVVTQASGAAAGRRRSKLQEVRETDVETNITTESGTMYDPLPLRGFDFVDNH